MIGENHGQRVTVGGRLSQEVCQVRVERLDSSSPVIMTDVRAIETEEWPT